MTEFPWDPSSCPHSSGKHGIYATLRDVKLLDNGLLILTVSAMARKKWYAVIVGKAVGVFASW